MFVGVNGVIKPKNAMSGTIGNSISSIRGQISSKQKIGVIRGVLPVGRRAVGTVNNGTKQVNSAINVIPTSEGIPYSGNYEVTPKTYVPVVLETMHRTMRDNVTVEKIPQFEVSNESGGKTLIIGEEYYG